jgi:glycoside/pentoside/hexuronide:cation symporter, GPH family
MVTSEDNNSPFVNTSIDTIITTAGFESYQLDISNVFVDADGDPLVYRAEVVNEAKGWQASFTIYGVAAVILFLIAFKGTRERVTPPKSQKASVGRDLKELVSNGPWLLLLAATITFILFVAVRSSVTAHYFKYVVGSQEFKLPFVGVKIYSFEDLVSAFNSIGQLASLTGVLFVSWVAHKLGKKQTFVLYFIIAIVSTSAFYLVRPEQIVTIFALQILGSITGGPLSVLLWALYADTADYAEWKNGRRATGLVFSASTMSQKFGWAFGAFLALTLMSQFGFEPNQEQSASSLHSLVLLFSVIPGGAGRAVAAAAAAVSPERKKVDQIVSDLQARRKAEEERRPGGNRCIVNKNVNRKDKP